MALRNLSDARLLSDTLARLARISPAHRASWGRMTSHQMLCHLSDACRMALGERACGPVLIPQPQRTLIRWIAFHTPLPWPRGQQTMREADGLRDGTHPTTFAEDHAAATALLLRVVNDVTIDGREHPMFGGLSRREWLRWAFRHTDYHLRQFGE